MSNPKPTRVVQEAVSLNVTPYLAQLVTANVPVRLFAANQERVFWKISNDQTADYLYYSYGPPLFVAGKPKGVPIALGGYDINVASYVWTGEFYIWSPLTGGAVYIVGFEGVATPP